MLVCAIVVELGITVPYVIFKVIWNAVSYPKRTHSVYSMLGEKKPPWSLTTCDARGSKTNYH